MKKYYYLLAAALIALASCQKTPEGGGETTDPVKVEFALKSDAVVNLGAESAISTVKFTAPADWTATVNYPGEEKDYVVITPASGKAGENEVKVTVQSLPKEEYGRYFTVAVKVGNEGADVTFYQGNVFIVSNSNLEVGLEGGKVDFSVVTNLEYDVTTYESFDWAPATYDKTTGKGSFNVAAAMYDERSAYVKFTIPAIQDVDENGEAKDHVERVYVHQGGRLQVAWTQQFFWGMFPGGTRESIAEVGDYIIINCGLTENETGGAYIFNKSDGQQVKYLAGLPSFTGVTNDDAGNVVISYGGDYPQNEQYELIVEDQTPLAIYVIPKDNVSAILAAETPDLSSIKPIITYSNGFYGYGLDNIRVTGDATKDAVITMSNSGGYSVQIADWDIKNGVFTDSEGKGYTKYVDAPQYLPLEADNWEMGIWTSHDIVAKHIGNSSQSGLFYMGYDNNYNLHYLESPTAEWQEVLVSGATWEEGFTCFSTVEWNGHKYLGFIGVPYFAWADWDYDGEIDGHMPGHVWLVNIDDPKAPVVVSKYEYYCDESNWQYGDNADMKLIVEGNDLAAYVVDAASSQYFKIIYPKL